MTSKIINVARFLGPHLLTMIQDAVKKWNSDIPSTHNLDFLNEIILISSKLEHLDGFSIDKIPAVGGKTMSEVIEECKTPPYSIKDLEGLHHAVKSYFEWNFRNTCNDIIKSVCDKNMDRVVDRCVYADKMVRHFQTSFSMGILAGPLNLNVQNEIRIIDDALLALTRIRPSRKVAPSGTLVMRDIHTIFYPDVNERDYQGMLTSFSSVYTIHRYSSIIGYSGVRLVPKQAYIEDRSLNPIYGISLAEMTIMDMMALNYKDTLPWYVLNDENFSPDAILNKILGSSVSSLSTVIVDVMVFMSISLKDSTSLTVPEIDSKIRIGPWTAVEDSMLFISPTDLYHSIPNSSRSRQNLGSDFDRMGELIELYKVCVSHFGYHIFTMAETGSINLASKFRTITECHPLPTPSAPSLALDLPSEETVSRARTYFEELGSIESIEDLEKIERLRSTFR
jgi:hypothetical protein